MKVRNFREVEPNNEMPGVALRTVISAQDGAPRFAMRVFEVAPGASTPFHAHGWEHEVFILEGEAKVKAVDGERALEPNDAVFVACQEEHCFVNTGPQVLRFICCIPHPETLPPEQAPACEG